MKQRFILSPPVRRLVFLLAYSLAMIIFISLGSAFLTGPTSYARVETTLNLLSDEFDDPATLSNWLEGPSTAYDLLDIDASNPGQLTFVPTIFANNAWYADYQAPLRYKLVTGDFAVVSYVSAGNRFEADPGSVPATGQFNSAGFLARDPASDAPGGSENYIMLNLGFQINDLSTEAKTTINSSSVLTLTSANGAHRGRLLLCRLDDTFYLYRHLDNESDWLLLETMVRADLPETLQVGLVVNAWDETPANSSLYAQFDYVRFAAQAPSSPSECTTLIDAPPPQPLFPSHSTLQISQTARLTGAKRLGINLGSHSQWGASQLLKNIIVNPGFEGGEYGMIFLTLAGATGTRVQSDYWQTIWNNGTWLIGQPVGFWDGAAFEILSGPAAGRAGTISNFSHENGRYTFYLDSDGPPPTQGDAIIVRQPLPGYYGDYQPFNAADPNDTRPGSPGAQSLRLLPPNQGWQASWQYGMDSAWRDGDRSSGKLFIADGEWHFEIWARAQNVSDTLTLRFYREGSPDFLNETIPLTAEWQHIVRDFTVPPGGDPGGPFDINAYHPILLFDLRLTTDSGPVWVDDVFLSRRDHVNPTVFTDKFVNRLKELNPGLLRNWDRNLLGNSLQNQLAESWARGTANFTPADRVAGHYHYSLHEFLALAAEVGAEPWYVIPPTFSEAELQNLVAYLAAEPGTHPYADLRANLGQVAPWTSLFALVHLEFGNEMWGSNGGGDPFVGATLGGGERLGQVAHNRLGVIRSSPFFDTTAFNLIIGSQAAFPFRTAEIESNSSNHNSVALAPYFGGLETWNNDQELFYALYARAQQDITPTGWVGEAQGYLDAAGQGTDLAIYEINFHTTGGNSPLDIRNDFVTSLGGGLALPLFMLTYQHALGVRNQAVFAATQYALPVEGTSDEYVRLFGTLRDLEASGRKRPTWLGVELANRAIRGHMLETAQDPPVWTQPPINGVTAPLEVPFIQAFAFADDGDYAAMLFNLHLTASHTVTLQLPTPPQMTATLHTLTADDLHADNEESEAVTIDTEQLTGFGQSYDLTLAPHSAYVLTWQTASDQSPQQKLYLPVIIRD